MRLVSGQNAPLGWSTVRFGIDVEPAMEIGVLAIDNERRAASGDTIASALNHVEPGLIAVDLDRVPASVAKVLCIASADTPAARQLSPSPLVASLTGQSPNDESVEFTIDSHIHPAMICFELYRRGEGWKVRAVGQGYAQGLDQLLADHGASPADFRQTAGGDSSPPAVWPLDGAEPLERMWMIFEDAARTTAAFVSARDYAAVRLDAELSAAIADPAMRNTAAATTARAVANERHDALVAQARQSYDRDATHLRDEISELDQILPAPMASWQSPCWQTSRTATACDGVRLGEVFAGDELGALRIPYCVPAPLRRPIWIDARDSATAVPIAAALILRLLAATPMPTTRLDLVDPTGGLSKLTTDLVAIMPREVVRSHRDVGEGLHSVVAAVDFAVLAARTEGRQAAPAILVLSDLGYGMDQDGLRLVLALASASAPLSIVIIGEGPNAMSPVDPIMYELFTNSQVVPVDSDAAVRDPWTEQLWQFVPDALAADWKGPLSVIDAVMRR